MRLMRRVAIALLFACRAPTTVGRRGGVVIDRFTARAAHLMVRDSHPDLPGPDAPIDFDRPPFITQGLGPDGVPVRYYNLDVQSDAPGTLYRLTHAGTRAAIPGQLDIVDAIPGDAGYSDFWRVSWVEVPASFVPGSIASAAQLRGLPTATTPTVIDCPIVPRGSTAREAHGVRPAESVELAYRGARVMCLHFAPDLTIDGDRVPTSPIYVTFATEAGPPSGFRTEPRTPQTHNVVMSLPGDLEYSPLWAVHVYDRAAFDRVRDASSATSARVVEHGPLVNCPIVWIGR
jgi:hypothetical protein